MFDHEDDDVVLRVEYRRSKLTAPDGKSAIDGGIHLGIKTPMEALIVAEELAKIQALVLHKLTDGFTTAIGDGITVNVVKEDMKQ